MNADTCEYPHMPWIGDQFMCHPAVVRQMLPIEHYVGNEVSYWKRKMLIPCCPCCGQGRTLLNHVAKTPALVVEADFTDWCADCRRRIASKLE